MNIRIEEQKIRFKISEEELKELMEGHIINSHIDFMANSMTVLINPNALGDNMEVKHVFDDDMSYITLLVPSHILSDLNDMGKNRDGVSAKQGEVSLSLQVDVRKDTRARDKGAVREKA
ncbi:MAG: DUF7009 family protein [Alphaproteobacteria bacterium]